MKHTNTNTTNDARRVSIYTHDGKHLHGAYLCYIGGSIYTHGNEYFFNADSATRERRRHLCHMASSNGGGVRPVKRNKNNRERAHKPQLLGATDAALTCASLVIKNAYRTQGLKGKTLQNISDAIESGDVAKYRKLTAATSSGAGAERGLYMVSCAIARAYGVRKRTDGIADEQTRTRLLYDALATDTSGAACEMYGEAYAALYAVRGHAGKALLYGAHLHAGQNAAQKVLYAARTKRARNVVSVEDWTREDLSDAAISVPKEWDVYTYEELDYMLLERAAIAARAEKDGNRYAAAWYTYKLRGLTQVDIAKILRVSLSTVEKTAAYVRRVFNELHGTAYGAAHARARE